ncbi:hypothetical protein WJX82_008991 [Trebouxia sp. C0006]
MMHLGRECILYVFKCALLCCTWIYLKQVPEYVCTPVVLAPRGPPWVSPEGSMNRAPIAEDQGRSFALSAYKLHQIHCVSAP